MDEPVVTPRTVFDRAHEIPAGAEREAYLNVACAGDSVVRQQVEGLLRAYDEAGSFLEEPAAEPAPTGPYHPHRDESEHSSKVDPETIVERPTPGVASPGEALGTQIGPYKLLKKLGAGGMGAVYLAEQEQPVRRQVALKIIKPGLDKDQVLARFEAERQALALMNHANIARVFDAGTTADGWPYFVMELVDGAPMTEFCDDNNLSIRQRLELFVPVCHAIQHAHQKGIIHRDIKPSNVLVMVSDARPIPKVIDFGIAKAIEQRLTERTFVTEAGAVIGTLRYMSPEQADPIARDVDTRSDVYSLGVLLYELLTGTTPLDAGQLHGVGLLDALLLIHGEESPRPSTRLSALGERLAKVAMLRQAEPSRLTKLLRGELDWIVMKALEKDRNRRYGTAADFAKDVECYLKDEPVQACPPSRRYRLGKFTRKHRALLASAAAFLVLLLAGVVGLSIAYRTVSTALARQTSAQSKTRDTLKMADAVVHTMTKNRMKLRATDKATLRNVVIGFKDFLDEPGNTEVERTIAAETHFLVANLNVLVGENAPAENIYRAAIQLHEKLADEFPGVTGYSDELARNYFDLGILLHELKKLAEAEAAYRRATDLHDKLATAFPAEPRYRGDLADELNNLGAVLRDQSKLPDAAKAYRQAIALGEKLVVQYPDFANYKINLAAYYGNLGNIVRDRGAPLEALASYDKAITSLNGVTAKNPDFEDARLFLRNVHWERANALGQLARHSEAIKDWERAIALNEDATDRTSLPRFLEAARMEEKLKTEVKPANLRDSAVLFHDAALVDAQALMAARASGEPTLEKHYSARALAHLREAKTAGFFRGDKQAEKLKNNHSFAPLQQDPSYQKFLAELVTNTQK